MKKFFDWLGSQEKWTSTLRNFAIIIGVGVALFGVIATLKSVDCALKKLNQDDSIFRKRLSIEAVYSTREVDFIQAFCRLKTARYYFEKHPDKKEQVLKEIYQQNNANKNINRLIDDLGLVSAKFAHIWHIYRDGNGERDVILNGVSPEIKEFSKICKAMSDLIPPGVIRPEIAPLLDEVHKWEWKDEKKYRNS